MRRPSFITRISKIVNRNMLHEERERERMAKHDDDRAQRAYTEAQAQGDMKVDIVCNNIISNFDGPGLSSIQGIPEAVAYMLYTNGISRRLRNSDQ